MLDGVVGRLNLTRTKSAMLKACSKSCGCCSRLSWPGLARAATSWLRTCSCATNSPSLTRSTRTRPRARPGTWDKVLWVLARRWCAGWREHLAFVTPDTVVCWHRQGWRLFWRWKSRSRGGRPHLSPEVRELILTMSRENRLWGTERIRGELLKLGIVVSNRSIRRYRWRGPGRPLSQTWRTFLANHAHHLWAADLLTVQTLTFKTLYVLVFIAHGRRQLVHMNVTANPTAAWVWRQVIEGCAGMSGEG